MEITQKCLDELRDGDTILMRVSSVGRTPTGYVTFVQSTGSLGASGRLQCLPPSTVVTVASD